MHRVEIKDWRLPEGGSRLEDMRDRLRKTRFPESLCPGWSRGTDENYLREFVAYLANQYDWLADCKRFYGEHVMAPIAGVADPGIHIRMPRGRIANGPALVLLHGWPSSGFEFVHLVDKLAQSSLVPIVVDLPGFGFSGATPAPAGPRLLAGQIVQALSQGLGLRDMIVHGNDWGSTTACWMAIDHSDLVRGVHISMMGMKPNLGAGAPALAEDERAWIKDVQKRLAADAGYREIQATRPNTAAYGLTDSPAGLAAWIIEKFHGWSGGGEGGEPPVARDDLAATITAYWLSGNIASANWIYAAINAENDTVAPPSGTGDIPVGVSFFGKGFFPPPPESWTRRIHRVQIFRVHASGGHYPALTEPQTLAADIAAFADGCNAADGSAPRSTTTATG
jgi:pimeloyl-ACP methyl ester carboxylesterase